ncbi:hypothetical protein PanWU01x14_175340 [Parasponia andersonii]|uniref:Uncharacterized protein n=1 Tax=Parasponia andersonii TaxID=3476 RepID=A0A2P5C870_PARAD|nr:hypothetical protein PanWU01x14_175340 [Parasponia andersonii]
MNIFPTEACCHLQLLAVTLTLPTPNNVLQRRPHILVAELGVLEGVAGRFRELDHRQLWRHLEYLRHDGKLPFSSFHSPPHLGLVFLLQRKPEVQLLRRRLELRHDRRGRALGREHGTGLPLALEQARQIEPGRH